MLSSRLWTFLNFVTFALFFTIVVFQYMEGETYGVNIMDIVK